MRSWAGTPKCTGNNYSQSKTAAPRGYSLGSYLGQVGADEPAPVTTLGVELIESQSEHQFIKNRSSTHGIEVCIKRKEHFCCINPTCSSDPAALILHIKAMFKFLESYKSISPCLTLWKPLLSIQA